MNDDLLENQLDSDMLGEVTDTLAEIEILISNMQGGLYDTQEGLAEVAVHARRLKALGFSFDHPFIDLLLHRMINYAESVEVMTDRRYDDFSTYTDILGAILEGKLESSGDQAEFNRSLPVARPVDIADLESLNIEILLVDPQRMSLKIFERELRSGGYRVSMTQRSYEAIELAARTQPDVIICSFVLDELTGIDVALALAAIPLTSKIPFALLTSYEQDAPGMELLPPNAAYISKSGDFGEGLAQALEKFSIT